MKSIYLFLSIFSLLGTTHAQIQRQSTSTARIVVNTDLVNGMFEIQDLQQEGSLIQDVSASLNYDAIEFVFDLQRGSANQHYNIDLTAMLNGTPLTIHSDDLFGFCGENLSVTQTGDKMLDWTNLFDRYIQLEGELVMILNAELWGPRTLPLGVDCQEEPEFTSKQIWPHYAAAGVGAGALIASFIIGNNSSDIYDNDYKAQLLEERAESFYQDANDKHHTELIFRYAGIGILTADAAVFVYRFLRYKRKLSVYQEYCQPQGVSIEPYLKTTPGDIHTNGLGVRLTYNF